MSTKIKCCDAMCRAQDSGTDNEGYGRLVYDVGSDWMMGCELPNVKFCPWCGCPIGDTRNQPMTPIDDAIIIAAVETSAGVDNCTVLESLMKISGQSPELCRIAIRGAEARGLIRYEVVEDNKVRFTNCTIDDGTVDEGTVAFHLQTKPEDGWKAADQQLFADLSQRISRLAFRVSKLEQADTIHDEEGEQDG